MSDTEECTRDRRECDACGRPICKRCSRCCERVPTDRFATIWQLRCPSFWCRLRKRLRLRPLRRGDTPRTAVCTGED